MKLLGSDDLFLCRQAAYLVFVGKELKESGYEIETFQQHLEGLTVPLVMKNRKGQPAAVFTYSEAWDAAAVDALGDWIAALRKAGVGDHVPVIVVSQYESAAAAAVPGVFQFISMPQADLPGDKRG